MADGFFFFSLDIRFRAVRSDVIQDALFITSEQAKQPPTREAGSEHKLVMAPLSELNGALTSVVARPGWWIRPQGKAFCPGCSLSFTSLKIECNFFFVC